jgi:hypothetical protein
MFVSWPLLLHSPHLKGIAPVYFKTLSQLHETSNFPFDLPGPLSAYLPSHFPPKSFTPAQHRHTHPAYVPHTQSPQGPTCLSEVREKLCR